MFPRTVVPLSHLERDRLGLKWIWDSQITDVLIQDAGWSGGQHPMGEPIPLTCASVLLLR